MRPEKPLMAPRVGLRWAWQEETQRWVPSWYTEAQEREVQARTVLTSVPQREVLARTVLTPVPQREVLARTVLTPVSQRRDWEKDGGADEEEDEGEEE